MNLCKLCFCDIEISGINSLRKTAEICQKCYNKFDVIFLSSFINGIKVLSLYEYDQVMMKLLYQFKACYDIDLKNIFVQRHLFELKIKYKNFIIVPIPSTKSSDENRGFNHVEEMFSLLGIPIYPLVKKKVNFKQSDLSREERLKAKNKFEIIDGEILTNKKVLIVDDVITTGASFNAVVELIKKYKPKRVEGLTICKKCRKT